MSTLTRKAAFHVNLAFYDSNLYHTGRSSGLPPAAGLAEHRSHPDAVIRIQSNRTGSSTLM
ncbi:MAG TPA: hypothetical protein PLW81_11175 [Thiobacillaceae bacterium]|nr:hypothetical protein [Thiobacillaceae bacterium]